MTGLPRRELAFSMEEYQSRLTRLRQVMATKGMDVLLMGKPQNVYYLTGYRTMGVGVDLIIVPLEGSLKHLSRYFEENTIRTLSWVEDIRTYQDNEDPFDALENTLVEMHMTQSRIGVEMASWSFPALTYERIKARLPQAEFWDASNLVDHLRLVKSQKELEYVRAAARISDLGMEAAINAVHAGALEHEIMAAVLYALYQNGHGDGIVPIILMSGPNSAMAHAVHCGRKLEQGDPLVIEIPGICKFYTANILRTIFAGPPSKTLENMHDAVFKAHELAVSEIRPGIAAEHIDNLTHQVIDEAGFGVHFQRRTGYTVGIFSTEGWWIEPLNIVKGETRTLEPGMVLAIEPGINAWGFGGVYVGNCLLVTEDGCEYLTTPCTGMIVK